MLSAKRRLCCLGPNVLTLAPQRLDTPSMHVDILAIASWTPRCHDDVIKWKHFPCYWPFVRGLHRSPVNSPHKGQWRGALMFSLICIWINGWVNNGEAGDLRLYRAHYDATVMLLCEELSAATILPDVKVFYMSFKIYQRPSDNFMLSLLYAL